MFSFREEFYHEFYILLGPVVEMLSVGLRSVHFIEILNKQL
jgi:hypothetical protein